MPQSRTGAVCDKALRDHIVDTCLQVRLFRKMAFLLQSLFHIHRIPGHDILFVFLWFLPFLTTQNLYDNSVSPQCLESVTKCFYKDKWTAHDGEPFYLESMRTILREHEKKLCHTLKAMYGNITEQMEDLCRPQSAVNTDISELGDAIETMKNKLEDLSLKKEELSICKESSQQAKSVTEGINELKNEIKSLVAAQNRKEQMELIECRRSLGNAQHNASQLRECEQNLKISQQEVSSLRECNKNVTASQEYFNVLHHLIRERYTEVDVVNAAKEKNMTKLQVLLDAGMKPDSRDPSYYENTPLHVAALKGQLEMIKLLVERKAPLEARNGDGNTPIIDAAGAGSIPTVKLLIELGANPLARGWHKETARLRAIREGHTKLADWLKKHGG